MRIDLEGRAGAPPTTLEWLEADGLGGFASGTACGLRTRRYHGLLTVATTPPTGRVLLVADLEVELDLGAGPIALSAHRYAPDVLHPDGLARLSAFEDEPFPTWTWSVPDPGATRVQDGSGSAPLTVELALAVPRERPAVALRWRLSRPVEGATLRVRPLVAARDVHALERERPVRLEAEAAAGRVAWRLSDDVPRVVAWSDASWRHESCWYRSFRLTEERDRGYGHDEDLASPGWLSFDLRDGEAGLVLAAEAAGLDPLPPAERGAAAWLEAERARRAALGGRLERAAEAYLVRRGAGRSLVAGYPWFTDWGRDTFLALRGLCLARGRHEEAAAILAAWAAEVSEGMLPNRFADAGDAPEHNAIDASLWFVVAVGELLAAAPASALPRPRRRALEVAVQQVLAGYSGGTRYGIRADADGLVAGGAPGWQLTWMDARVDGEVVTPRAGKPVEVQALWANALAVGARLDARWRAPLERALKAFDERFWSEERGWLRDVVDADGVAGAVDETLRPNQVLAVGGLPLVLVEGERARRVVDVLEERLWTPLGLRTLPPDDPRYRGACAGGPAERDRAYHQGTVWPWLLGPFVEAWVRARGGGAEARREARERFVAPLLAHLDEAGLGHVSEIADGDAPHAPRGCPFQAWSLGELLRLERVVLADPPARPGARSLTTAGSRP